MGRILIDKEETVMKRLLVLDQKNYTDEMAVYERYCVRAVIIRDGKIAAQKGAAGDYKILGGGMDEGENVIDALCREAEEESGLLIRRDSVREIGEILEMRKDIFDSKVKYICHTLYYRCEADTAMGHMNLTRSEIEKGYKFVWATPAEIIAGNGQFLYQPWILRDSRFVQIYVTGAV